VGDLRLSHVLVNLLLDEAFWLLAQVDPAMAREAEMLHCQLELVSGYPPFDIADLLPTIIMFNVILQAGITKTFSLQCKSLAQTPSSPIGFVVSWHCVSKVGAWTKSPVLRTSAWPIGPVTRRETGRVFTRCASALVQ
jgi:hypothetical protein